MNANTTPPTDRLPFEMLVPAIREIESTAHRVAWHLDPRHRDGFAARLRSIADGLDSGTTHRNEPDDGFTQLSLFG